MLAVRPHAFWAAGIKVLVIVRYCFHPYPLKPKPPQTPGPGPTRAPAVLGLTVFAP